MAKFRFVVRSPQGKTRRGTVTEDTMADARASLQKAGYEVVEIFEETDIVIHQHKGPSGKKGFKPERARIIDFELTPVERVGEFFSNYFLRREAALLLLVAGICWLIIGYVNREPIKKTLEPTLYDLKLAIKVNLNSLEGRHLRLELPEIPYSQEIDLATHEDNPVLREGETARNFELDLQLEKQVSRLKIQLLDDEKKKVGVAETSVQVGSDTQSVEVTLDSPVNGL